MKKQFEYLISKSVIIQILRNFLLAFGTIWLIIEFPSSINNDVKNYIENFGYNILIYSGITSLVFGIYHSLPKTKVQKEFKASNTSIEIKVGDIFLENGNIAFAGSEYFDTNYDRKSNLSLKSKSIINFFNSDIKNVDRLINDSIEKQNLLGSKNEEKKGGKKYKYPIGSTIILPQNDRKIFLIAIAQIIYESSRKQIISNPQLLQAALDNFWKIVKAEGRMAPLTIPVFGSGIGRINLSFLLIVQLIILSFVTHSKNTTITEKLTIIIYKKDYKPNDFKELSKFLDSIEI